MTTKYVNRQIKELRHRLSAAEAVLKKIDPALANSQELKDACAGIRDLAAQLREYGISSAAHGETFLKLCEGYTAVLKRLLDASRISSAAQAAVQAGRNSR